MIHFSLGKVTVVSNPLLRGRVRCHPEVEIRSWICWDSMSKHDNFIGWTLLKITWIYQLRIIIPSLGQNVRPKCYCLAIHVGFLAGNWPVSSRYFQLWFAFNFNWDYDTHCMLACLREDEGMKEADWILASWWQYIIERAKRAHSLVMTFEIFCICMYVKCALFRV